MFPKKHQTFLDKALPQLVSAPRFIGVAAAGSTITGQMDEFSDLDLVLVTDDASIEAVRKERIRLAGTLGKLLVGFTGEHVGEPRLLICLYDDPLIHVDLKFVSASEFRSRIENPTVLFERDGALTKIMRTHPPVPAKVDSSWIEDRFWVWIHYAALRLGRGELFEVIDFLGFLRQFVLGPMSLAAHGQLPRGSRRLEQLAPRHLEKLRETVASYDAKSCGRAIRAAIDLYRALRAELGAPSPLRSDAETAAVAYFEEVSKNGCFPGSG